MSYKPQVQCNDDPKWYDNALRFATIEEAQANARDLAIRWFSVTSWRASEAPEPVNYAWDKDKGLVSVKELV